MAKAGIEMPEPGQGRPPELTAEQKATADKCFEENGIEPPKGPRMR